MNRRRTRTLLRQSILLCLLLAVIALSVPAVRGQDGGSARTPTASEFLADHTLLWQGLAVSVVILLVLVVWNRKLALEIGKRKKAEAAHLAAETRYRLLFDQSPDGIVIIDPATAALLEFNETAHRQLGYSREEFFRLSIPDIEAVETTEETRARITKVVHDGRTDFETRHRTRQGEIRDILVTAQSRETLGRPVYHCVWRDITEYKRMEAALRLGLAKVEASRQALLSVVEDQKSSDAALKESEAQFRAIFEVASVGIVQVDPRSGTVVRSNRKYSEITGYSDAELRTMNFPELTHPEDRQRDWELFSSAARGETSDYQNEKRYIRKDGSIAWVRLNASFIRDETGQPLRTVAVCEDVTEHLRNAEEKSRLEDQLRQMQRVEAIGRLAGGVAHEFNNLTDHSRLRGDAPGPDFHAESRVEKCGTDSRGGKALGRADPPAPGFQPETDVAACGA